MDNLKLSINPFNGEYLIDYNGCRLSMSEKEMKSLVQQYQKTEYEEIVVGYRIEVNGEVFTDSGWLSKHLFRTISNAQTWLNIYGYGSGILPTDTIKIIEVKDIKGNANNYAYVNGCTYDDTITEYCYHCEREVELKTIFANQVCPCCGELITPCSLCDQNVSDCKNCPLGYLYYKIKENEQ